MSDCDLKFKRIKDWNFPFYHPKTNSDILSETCFKKKKITLLPPRELGKTKLNADSYSHYWLF